MVAVNWLAVNPAVSVKVALTEGLLSSPSTAWGSVREVMVTLPVGTQRSSRLSRCKRAVGRRLPRRTGWGRRFRTRCSQEYSMVALQGRGPEQKCTRTRRVPGKLVHEGPRGGTGEERRAQPGTTSRWREPWHWRLWKLPPGRLRHETPS